MRKIFTMFLLLAACTVFVFAHEDAATEAPAAPANPVKGEIVGQIALKAIPPMTVATVTEKAADYIPEGGYKAGMEGASQAWERINAKGFEKLGAWMAAGGKPTGPAITVYFNDPEKEPAQNFVCKMAFPTSDKNAAAPVIIEQWPEMSVVSCTYKGPYEGSGEAWLACDKWLKDNSYETAGAPMEVYLAGPADKVPPSEFLTEIRMPVKKIEAKPAEEGKK